MRYLYRSNQKGNGLRWSKSFHSDRRRGFCLIISLLSSIVMDVMSSRNLSWMWASVRRSQIFFPASYLCCLFLISVHTRLTKRASLKVAPLVALHAYISLHTRSSFDLFICFLFLPHLLFVPSFIRYSLRLFTSLFYPPTYLLHLNTPFQSKIDVFSSS